MGDTHTCVVRATHEGYSWASRKGVNAIKGRAFQRADANDACFRIGKYTYLPDALFRLTFAIGFVARGLAVWPIPA